MMMSRTSDPSYMKTLRKQQLQEREMKKDTGLVKIGPNHKVGGKVVSEERLYAILPVLEQYYELWLAYPDKLIDQLLPLDTSFKLFPFQTLGLRVNQRHKRVFQSATRGQESALTHSFH